MSKLLLILKFLFLALHLVILSCSSKTDKIEFIERSVDEIYNEAMKFMDEKK